MSVEIIDGVEHVYAPNPKMQGEVWEKEYPTIKSSAKWLINKYTGELFPNTEEFARRSDILEPYMGEMPDDGQVPLEVKEVRKVLSEVADTEEKTAEELSAL